MAKQVKKLLKKTVKSSSKTVTKFVRHTKQVLYSHSKRGIKNILNSKIEDLSNALNNQQQNYNSKIEDLSNALNNQQQNYNSKIEDLSKTLNNQQKIINVLNLCIDNLFMVEHISRIKHMDLSNALISYGYYGFCNPKMMNIGDYVQSVAAKQFLSKIDKHIDRDNLSEYNGPNVNLIMNAWWYMYDKNEDFNSMINPLFVSFHLNNTESVKEKTLSYLKQHEPIGCRDYNTRNFLLNHGIKAYFSGCLTLTLGNTYHFPENKRKKEVFFVDYDLDTEKDIQIRENIENILQSYKDYSIKKEHHMYKLNNDIEGNFKTAESLLDKYSKASLVITTRLHCALPCLAMHTPVIFVVQNYDEKRYDGLIDLLNVIGKDKNGFFINTVLKNDNLVINSNKYEKYKDILTRLCDKFMGVDSEKTSS